VTKEDIAEKILKAVSAIESKLDEKQLDKIEDELAAIEDAASEDLYNIS
jgi:hypothetical protein